MPFFFQPVVNSFMARFQSLSVKTVTNSTAETSILPPSISGSKTISSSFWTPGATARLIIRGECDTATLAPGTATFKVKLGSTTLVTGTAGALLGGLTSSGFLLSLTITCQSVGTNGTVLAAGEARYPSGLVSQKGTIDLLSGTKNARAVTVNTTVDMDIDATVQWSIASTSNSITQLTGTLELLSQ